MRKYLLEKKWIVFLFIIMVPLSCLASVLFALSFNPIIEAAIKRDQSSLVTSGIFALLFALSDLFFAYLVKLSSTKMLKESAISIKQDLFSKLVEQDISAAKNENSGNYLSVLTNDVNLVKENYFSNLLMIYRVIMSFVISLVAVIVVDYRIALVLLLVGLCSVILPKLLEKRLSQLQENHSKKLKKYLSSTKDFFEGLEVIKSFHIQKKVFSNHHKHNQETEIAGYKASMYTFSVGWVSMLFSSLMYVFTFVIGGYFVINGSMSVGLVVALSQLIGGVVAPIEQLPEYLAEYHSSKSIANQLKTILDKKNKEDEGIVPNVHPNHIHLKDVSYKYQEESNRLALNQVNVKFEYGKRYAIVGESGSGKTTLAKLILGFLPNYKGKICIGNENLDTISKTYLYQNVCYIHQNTFIFDDTLRNNITLYQEYRDEEVLSVLHKAGLSSFYDNLPEGLDTLLGENGSKCSGGERQRISIARSLIAESKFLILDEATSSLDNITAHEITNGILNLQDTSCILITHALNPSVLNRCDWIYVMKKGSLIEQGTFNDLLDYKTYFCNLYNYKTQ
jgi:ATP-binding cassette, subfamily B, bacterial